MYSNSEKSKNGQDTLLIQNHSGNLSQSLNYLLSVLLQGKKVKM